MKKLLCLWLFSVLLFCGAPLYASQNALVVPDGTGASVRAGFNNGLNTLATLNSGPTAPPTTYPYMLWVDTTNNLLKIMNSANSAWIAIGAPSVANLGLQAALPSGTSSQYLRGDLTMQTLNAAAAGAEPAITPGTTSQYWRGDKTWQGIGTAANDLVQLNGSGQLPAVDGSQLTNLPSTGGISTQNIVTSSRAFSTVYHNTTGKPMMVAVTIQNCNGAIAYSDSNSSPLTEVACLGTNNANIGAQLHFWVLSGNYYEVVNTSGTLVLWTEWY